MRKEKEKRMMNKKKEKEIRKIGGKDIKFNMATEWGNQVLQDKQAKCKGGKHASCVFFFFCQFCQPSQWGRKVIKKKMYGLIKWYHKVENGKENGSKISRKEAKNMVTNQRIA